MRIDKLHNKPKYMRKAIIIALNEAKAFMYDRYPTIRPSQYEEVLIKLSTTCRFAKYCWPQNGNPATVRIESNRDFWLTYKKKTVGLWANEIPHIDLHASLTVQLIHELTHHVQWLRQDKHSEVETTRNEIKWMKENRPQYYSKLTEV